MKKMLSSGLLGMGLALYASMAMAGPVADATKASLTEAREKLVALLSITDKAAQAKQVEEVQAASAKVDALVGKNADTLKAFNEVWTAFKTTRDSELIPNVLAGKKDEAKALATGVQAGRFKQMQEILAAITQ
ncbi:MAG: hypothetical protein HQL80_11185 [Magnetococcales bacterium]|nr:hypothetical protein [Magnetococcales bacterium]